MISVAKPTPTSTSATPLSASDQVEERSGAPAAASTGGRGDVETGGDIRQPGGRSDSDPVGASAAGAPDEQSVRVVTVAFNPGEELERFLASLAAATERRLVVVIADNGTEHDVVTAAAQRHGRVSSGTAPTSVTGRAPTLRPRTWRRTGSWWPIPISSGTGESRRPHRCRSGQSGGRLPGAPPAQPRRHRLPLRACPALPGQGAGHAVLGKIWPANPFSAAYHTAGQGAATGPGQWAGSPVPACCCPPSPGDA